MRRALLFMALAATAAAGYRLDWTVVGAGGGSPSGAGSALVAAGQTAAGRTGAGRFLALLGFWQAEALTGLADEMAVPPSGPVTRLAGVAPSPFADRALFRYSLAEPGRVRLEVFDPVGRLVRRLVNEPQARGEHTCTWDGTDGCGRVLPNSLYFCRFTAGAVRSTVKVLLLR